MGYSEESAHISVLSGRNLCYLLCILTRAVWMTPLFQRPTFATTRHQITSDIAEDPVVKAIVEEYASGMAAQMDRVIGETAVELDAR